MKPILHLFIFILFATGAYAQDSGKLHAKAFVIDTHNDILGKAMENGYSFEQDLRGKTHSDLQRMRDGGLDAQIFSVWCDGDRVAPYAWARRQIDTLNAWVGRSPSAMHLVRTPAGLQAAVKKHRLAALIGVEGGHMIENSLEKLDTLHALGASYLTLTWNNSNPWATSAMDESAGTLGDRPKGLTDFGKTVVKRMNALGMMVDVSHVGEQTFRDVINTTTKPVIASHSSAWEICPVFRNLTDDQLRAIARNGGVVQLNFYSGFLDSTFTTRSRDFRQELQSERDSLVKSGFSREQAGALLDKKYAVEREALRPPAELFFTHLDHVVKIAGIDHVGLGSDFDGISSTPQQLDDVTCYPLITRELVARGYSPKDIRKILGVNFLRVFRANTKGVDSLKEPR